VRDVLGLREDQRSPFDQQVLQGVLQTGAESEVDEDVDEEEDHHDDRRPPGDDAAPQVGRRGHARST
jgi:hypothetical protein